MTVVLQYSKIFSDTNDLKYYNELNEKYDTHAFGFRGSKYDAESGYTTYGSFHGFILYLGLLRKISDQLLMFSIPLLFVLSAIYFYRIARFFFNEEWSILATLLLVFSAPFFYTVNILGVISFTTFCFLGFFYYFYTWLSIRSNQKNLLLACVFAWLGFWMRIDFAVLVLFTGLAFWRELYAKRKAIKLAWIGNVLGISVISLLFYLAADTKAYGRIFGYFWAGIPLREYVETAQSGGSDLIIGFLEKLNIGLIAESLFRFVFLVSPIVSTICVLYLLFSRKNAVLNRLLIVFGMICIFYFRNKWSGYEYEFITLSTSFTRYIVPAWFILILVFIYVFERIAIHKSLKLIIFSLLICGEIMFAIFSRYGIQSLKWETEGKARSMHAFIDSSPENSIFLTTAYDKYVFPDRQNYLYNSVSPKNEMYCRVPRQLLDDGYPLYIEHREPFEQFLAQCDLEAEDDYFAPFLKVIR